MIGDPGLPEADLCETITCLWTEKARGENRTSGRESTDRNSPDSSGEPIEGDCEFDRDEVVHFQQTPLS